MPIQGSHRARMMGVVHNQRRHQATGVGSEDCHLLFAVPICQTEPAIFALSAHLFDNILNEGRW